VIKYTTDPFIDVTKTNRYFYCISYAKEKAITSGYILNNIGKATCENAKEYMSSPFCAENTISRIEAAAILLRRANLWSETLNSGIFDKNLIIPDVTTYWYGYAKKAIEAGLIKQKSDGSIGQNEKITKAEFAIMAGKILALNQCNIVNDVRNSFNSEFQIIDSASKKSA
jgi:S-layer homology domain